MVECAMTGIREIDRGILEARRERVRRTWAYHAVDHLPLCFIMEDFSRHSLRELCESGELQLEANQSNIDRLLRLLPDDYIPVARLWPGYVTIATMFGMRIHWSSDPSQAPGVEGKLIRSLDHVGRLTAPDPRTSGLMPFNLEWMERFRRELPPEVALAGIDLGGPLNTAKDLFETDLLFTALYDAPELMAGFLDLAARVQVSALREIVGAAGGPDRMSSIDFDPVWAPEGRKGFVSDDVCAGLSPEFFLRFSVPASNAIFARWPGGRIHNCGPHPAARHYLHHDPPINGLNCSFRYTRADFPRIREAFRGRGIVELMFDNGESAAEIVRGYEEAAAALAPEVAALPVVWLNETWSDDAVRGLYDALLGVSTRWAGAMRWREEA
jgi:hypothetical protein